MAVPDSIGYVYRLRAGNPMPITGSAQFMLHTFRAEETKVSVYTCTTDLPATRDFRAWGGDLINANFSRLPIVGGDHFQGKEVSDLRYINESEYGFNF